MGKTLAEHEAEAFLEKNGFPVVKRKVVKTIEQAIQAAVQVKYPVAMKVYGKTILHKSDVGGVVLDVRNEAEIKKTFAKLKKIKGMQGVTVQHYTTGIFMLLGLKHDATFGHALVVGSGGIYTEILKDVSFRVCPITESDAEAMLQELRMYPLLEGARGRKAVNKSYLKKLLVKLSQLPKKYPKLQELDINPLVLNEQETVVVDARAGFS